MTFTLDRHCFQFFVMASFSFIASFFRSIPWCVAIKRFEEIRMKLDLYIIIKNIIY